MLNILLALLGIVGLVSIRAAEEFLFYDPFLQFFHEANKSSAFPHFEWGPLILNHLFRFILNLIFSLLIVQAFFSRKDWTLQAALLITLAFAITFPLYLYCIYDHFEIGYLFSFYVRRFVIQPLIVLLIIPLFYYRKAMSGK